MTEAALAKHIADLIGPGRSREADVFVRLLRERLASVHDTAGLDALDEVARGTASVAARNHLVRTLLRLGSDDEQTAAAMRAFDPAPDREPASVGSDVWLRSVGLLTTEQLEDLARRSITTVTDLIAVIDVSPAQTAKALNLTIDRTASLREDLWSRLPSSVRTTLENVDRRPLVTGLLVQEG